MNVVDSSGWLEYFAEGANAGFFAAAIEDVEGLLVPTLSLYEVYRRLAQQLGDEDAWAAVAAMQQGRIVELSADLAVSAARLAAQHKLPMADAVILATARAHDATLWTQDSDFEGLPGVQYRPRN